MKQRLNITINREFGSGGRLIGQVLAERLKFKLVDKLVLEEAAKAMHMSPDYLKQFEEKAPSIWDNLVYSTGGYHGLSIQSVYHTNTNNDLYIMQAGIIKEMAEAESCVFIGRCANNILEDKSGTISVFLHAPIEHRIKNLTQKYGFNCEKDMIKEIEKVDKQRSDYYKMYTQQEWKDLDHYHLTIDTSELSIEQAVDMICLYIEKRSQN